MAYTTIDKPSDYFNTVLYTGTGSSQNITGVGFQPDLLWLKSRSNADFHYFQDVVRGVTKQLATNTTGAETSYTNGVTAFGTDGFTVDSSNWSNRSGGTFVGWNWLADNTSGSSNTDGSITSTVSANTTSGFSIVSYTGTANANETVGHGLNSTPDIVLIKNRDRATEWPVINPRRTSTVDTNMTYFNTTSIESDHNNIMGDNLPNATTFGIDDDTSVNVNGENFIAYCWHSVKGFSKFGSYVGNGSTDGSFIYTGFKTAMFIIKNMSASEAWAIRDTKRAPYNVGNVDLFPNLSNVETTSAGGNNYDILSNGIKLRGADARQNQSGQNYIYMAFAENPFVTSTGIPTTAR